MAFLGLDLCFVTGVRGMARANGFGLGVSVGLRRGRLRGFFSRMVEEFELDCFVDRILVERVAMYLVRIARAEAYETAVGVSDKSVLWGGYISRLDNTLRGLLNDLAVSRVKRKQLEKNEALLVSVDELMKKFAKAEVGSRRGRRTGKRRATVSSRMALLSSWRSDYKKLCLTVRRDEDIG